ncbi:iron chaperone [Kineococcus auxinigenes]|uniref:iron chaperone n=1 Tax=unclassified Kineococcus TaxID=2621656 RepID=UPI003D7E93EE
MTTTADHDAYIAAAPEPFQPSLNRLRAVLARALPQAEEIVAYNMPGFRIDGTVVASYAAFSKQCGLYLLPSAISEHAEEIEAAGLKATKTGITFSPHKPIPDDLVERLAQASRNDARA